MPNLCDASFIASIGDLRRDAFDLEQDPAGLDDGDPALGVALALAHAGLERLLGVRLVREDPDPDLAAALHVAGDRDAAGLDLAGRDPAGLERLQAEVAERDVLAALGRAGATPRCCFRNLTFFGINMASVSSISAVARRPFSLSRSPL